MRHSSFFLDEIGWLRIQWVLVLMIVSLYVIVGVVVQIGFPSERIGIEQVRADVATVGCSAAEDAVGLAIETNRTIKSNQFWAHHWLTGLAVPNGWDDIAVIEIPDCQ